MWAVTPQTLCSCLILYIWEILYKRDKIYKYIYISVDPLMNPLLPPHTGINSKKKQGKPGRDGCTVIWAQGYIPEPSNGSLEGILIDCIYNTWWFPRVFFAFQPCKFWGKWSNDQVIQRTTSVQVQVFGMLRCFFPKLPPSIEVF